MATRQIGWYTLKEDTIFHNNGFECAAWYEDIKVPAGRYPIVVYDFRVMHFDDEARKRFNGQVDGHIRSAYIPMTGTVVSDDFGSRYFGMPIGDYDSTKNAGQPSRYTMHLYMYSLADSVLNDPDTPYELFPEFRAVEETFISSFDNKPCTTHSIYIREGCA